MKKYFVKYYGFSNVYDVVYSENKEQEKQAGKKGYERITRKHAEKLISREKERRKYDQAFSGYAPILIYPIDFNAETENEGDFTICGNIAERRTKK